jgi:predicted MFS family arabinose efflux permease
VLIGVLAASAAGLITLALPETLAPAARSPIDLRATIRVAADAVRNRVFVSFVVVFGVMAAAQLTFAVVSPFLYQDGLGFKPAAYCVIALVVGFANLLGELACGALAVRTSTRRPPSVLWPCSGLVRWFWSAPPRRSAYRLGPSPLAHAWRWPAAGYCARKCTGSRWDRSAAIWD